MTDRTSKILLKQAIQGAHLNPRVDRALFDLIDTMVIKSVAVGKTEHGAGSIGTSSFGAPKTYRWTENGIIVTQTLFDITLLLCKGGNADDAIGLAAGAAYIGRYVVATDGVVFKAELSCLETPGQGTATITGNIDIHTNSSATIIYDGGVGTNSLVDGGTLLIGQTAQSLTPTAVANDYIYIVEADTAATTGIYNAGMFVLTRWGHPVLA